MLNPVYKCCDLSGTRRRRRQWFRENTQEAVQVYKSERERDSLLIVIILWVRRWKY